MIDRLVPRGPELPHWSGGAPVLGVVDIAMSDGCRASADSWGDLPRDRRRRRMRTPVPAVGDGAPGSRKAPQGIGNAEDRDHALRAGAAFEKTYGAKFPEAVEKITDDVNELPAFYDFPAEHWIRPRTTNPIEFTFAAVRLHTNVR
ncbi:transposase [Streptomyces sp. NPDC017202]|uniref:transposase n=1 Tax=Streptomyces sp. NPDC017202 TaxID=3364981 RepID=UPI00378A63DE